MKVSNKVAVYWVKATGSNAVFLVREDIVVGLDKSLDDLKETPAVRAN